MSRNPESLKVFTPQQEEERQHHQQHQQPHRQQQRQLVVVEADRRLSTGSQIVILILLIVWVVLSISAGIMSLVCGGASGPGGLKAVGVLLAIFLGPFYWIFYVLAGKSYCGHCYAPPV